MVTCTNTDKRSHFSVTENYVLKKVILEKFININTSLFGIQNWINSLNVSKFCVVPINEAQKFDKGPIWLN